jgi:hypothetical protein
MIEMRGSEAFFSGRRTGRDFKITEDELKVGKSSLAIYLVIPVKTGIRSKFPPTRE